MPCKIWCFHDDYEEGRLLGYKNPVRTSHEIHHVSAEEPNRLVLCKICGIYDGDYGEYHLLGLKTPVRTWQEIHEASAMSLAGYCYL
jgi:hypothetical protein